MGTRVFGPVRGAGVQVKERSGEQPIEPGALGLVGYAGILEKGPVGELIGPLASAGAFKKKCGAFNDDTLLPDAAFHYFKIANGAGGIMLVRVTDGNERAAGPYFLLNNSSRYFNLFARRPDLVTPMGRVTAKNGGRWGGKGARYAGTAASGAAIVNGAGGLTTAIAVWKKDEWKGGYVELNAVPTKRYKITGNTAIGVIATEVDSTMAADLAASATPTDYAYYLVNDDVATKRLSIEIRDGEEKPTTEFGIFVYVDGILAYKNPDLSLDTADKRYWVNVINNDDANDEITVEDVWTGARTADIRPANHYGKNSVVSALQLTAVIHDFTITSPVAAGNPTATLGTTADAHLRQKITITMTSATAGTAVSDRFGALGTVTLGTLFNTATGAGGATKNKWVPPFTVTAGATPLVATDTLVINYKPFTANELADGFIYPDKINFRATRFRIASNDHKIITAIDGSDMTTVAATSDEFMVEAARPLEGGRDGVADLADANYNAQAWSVDASPFNQIVGKNYGIVKYATPGVSSTLVQKAGIAYAAAKNMQYREEIPSGTVTETTADTYCNDTIGRSDYAVVAFPSYCYVDDPVAGGSGRQKLVSMTGMIHGREARIAADFNGYHKAGSDIEAILPEVVRLTTGNTVLNEEFLNPRGINVIKKNRGNFIIWGDRTLWINTEWKFKHQREQMSYYEHVLQESFDFIIFQINDASGRSKVNTSMVSFFFPEWKKGALDNDFTFKEAAAIKIDKENNPAVVKAAGDMVCEISLRLVDTVERLIISIGKTGIFEAVAP